MCLKNVFVWVVVVLWVVGRRSILGVLGGV